MLVLKRTLLALKAWWLLLGKKVAYCLCAIVAISSGILCAASIRTIPFILLGLFCGLLGAYLLKLSIDIAEPISEQTPFQGIRYFFERFINVGSGTYNESVNVFGDYVQGDKNVFGNFDFNQDLPSAIIEIQQLLQQMAGKVGGTENAQQKIIDDLAALAHSNSELFEGLRAWLESSNLTPVTDRIDAAEKIVELATGSYCKSYEKSVFKLDKQYKRLKYLLKTAQWRKADDETVRVIAKLMPNSASKHGCTSIDVDEIPTEDLRTINKLWLQASGGRFGFSVQKQIWLDIVKIYQNSGRLNLRGSEYDAFVEAVGWSSERSRIYHVTFKYLVTNPRGHLPVKVLLWETYNSKSNYCYLSNCLFDDFMKRDYSEIPFLPSWLRRLLLLD